MKEKTIVCADVIAKFQGKIVLVQRFTDPAGIALPGGKQDSGEFLCDTARREFFEETGLMLEIDNVFSTFADPNRDPRGRYVSTVFVGRASGSPKDESGKTKVIGLRADELSGVKDRFIFDHREMLEKYLKLLKTKKGGDKLWQIR
ncbi:MAG: NUDIX domain-containing protein [Candidatus Nealsonbacteria bacterium]|nr:NUDIX domain-containing protein [Candidatus Nealsonbacteria bacterium]